VASMNNINVDLSSWIIDQNEIHDFLNNLDINASTGPDGVPSIFLKFCSFELIKPLHLIFNKSLSLGYFPNIWKKSFITPIHKSGDKHNVSNYRPIFKLSHIHKMFEAIITKKLTKIMSPYICKNQHGFRPKMSSSTNILLFQSKILDSLNNHAQLDSIYTDFQKAFDKINHSLLLNKLVSFGIHGSILDWIKSYISSRTQVVKVSFNISNDFLVTSGVPQGSHLGPSYLYYL